MSLNLTKEELNNNIKEALEDFGKELTKTMNNIGEGDNALLSIVAKALKQETQPKKDETNREDLVLSCERLILIMSSGTGMYDR
jgi:hypothetical protein